MSTRAVRLTFLCAAATLVACGRAPEPIAGSPGVAANPAAVEAEPPGGAAIVLTTEPAGEPVGPAGSAAPQPGGAAAPAPVPLPALSDLPVPKDSTDIAPPGMDAGTPGDAENAPELAKPITGGDKLVGVESTLRDRSRRYQPLCCGFDWGGGTDVADQVYGYFGNSYASLYYDTYNSAIYGTLDGRRVYVEDGDNYLYGSIGYSSVNLRRTYGWFSSTITGTFGGHYVKLNVGSRSLKGYEGSVYLNTSTSWDGRTLSGTYGGYKVRVVNSAGTMSGYFGYKTVRVTSGYSSYSGWIGNKPVNLRSDMASAAFLRRMPLLAADDWMVVGTLTEFFD